MSIKEGVFMKILAFAASSSSASINKKLATYAANLVAQAEVEVLDINNYEMPIFSEDLNLSKDSSHFSYYKE